MRRADNLTTLKSGNLNPLGLSRSVQGLLYLATILMHLSICPYVLFRNSIQISIKLRAGDAGSGAVEATSRKVAGSFPIMSLNFH
jgi:hypothetical protein